MGMTARSAALAVALCCVACIGPAARGDTPPTVEDVEKAWKEREAAFPAAEVDWAEDFQLTKGTISTMWKKVLLGDQLKLINEPGQLDHPSGRRGIQGAGILAGERWQDAPRTR